MRVTRRAWLIGSAAVAGGVAIGYRQVVQPGADPLAAALGPERTALTPYVVIDAQGITIIAPRAEMGQGIRTTLAALVAEELDVSLEDVRVEHGPASELYSNTVAFRPRRPKGRWQALKRRLRPERQWRPTQLTGGQTSTQDAFVKMRKAGAAARVALVQAAATRLGVEPGALETRDGAVVDGKGARIPYVELAARAAAIELPQDPVLKPSAEWRLLGRSLPRVDMVEKCSGAAEYSIDVRPPGLLHATVRLSPYLGGPMESFDARAAETMRGVREIVPIDGGVIVIATNTWYAFQAAKAIDIRWGPAPYPASTDGHFAAVEAAFDEEPFSRPRNEGDVEAALAEAGAVAGRVVEGEYRAPYLAHATMEPLNATARLAGRRLDIWAGNQFPTKAVLVGASIAGVDPDAVRVHTTYMGGGFGRRLEMDFIRCAVHAARAVEGTPVKVTWSREEDTSHGVYRPLAMARFRAAVSEAGPAALDLRLSSPSLAGSANVREGRSDEIKRDKFLVTGAQEQPYALEHYRVTAHRAPNLLPVGWWRSVGESQNSFFHESVMDELAHAAGADPLEMRLSLLEHGPSRQVLEAVREMSGWGSPLPDGHARGVAYVLSSGAATAQVIEIRATGAGIEIVNAYVAADVGIALDPRNIEAQLEGALIFGLTAAMTGEITVSAGTVDQRNFDDYPLMRLGQAPAVHVRILESGERIYGVGEASTPAAAPALGNAIFAATGRRLRELPFGKRVRFA